MFVTMTSTSAATNPGKMPNARTHRACSLVGIILFSPMLAASTCNTTIVPGPGDTPNDTGGTVSFVAKVLPIFSAKCLTCHQPGGEADTQGISMNFAPNTAYDSIVNVLSDQDPALTRVVPSDSANSLLYLKISSATPPVGERMPLMRTPLSQTEIDTIKKWIDQGALDN